VFESLPVFPEISGASTKLGANVTTILSYIRIFFFLGGTLAGIQVPYFVDQYGKSLASHYLESQKGIDEFQNDADKYFGGSIEALVAHYRNSGDAVFSDGGDSIQAIYNRYLALKKSLSSFKSNVWNAYYQALLVPVADVHDEVRSNYSYAVKLDTESVGFGLFSGLLLTVVIEFALRALGALVTSLTRRLNSAPS
jgi:Protein of unknown function (DUF2937)